jgi:hypothetical protein
MVELNFTKLEERTNRKEEGSKFKNNTGGSYHDLLLLDARISEFQFSSMEGIYSF